VNTIKELIEVDYTKAFLDLSELTRAGHDAATSLAVCERKVDRVERQPAFLSVAVGEDMFKRIAVVFDESLGAFQSLTSTISLAKTLGAELQTVTFVEHSAPSVPMEHLSRRSLAVAQQSAGEPPVSRV